MSGCQDHRYRLSKSKIASYEHCPKRLWLQIHRRDAARYDEGTLARFRFGHEVGEKARFGVRGGVLVDTGMDMEAAISRTQQLLQASERRPIFEATFQHQDVLVRVDILMPEVDESWRAIEVKASTRIKGYMLADLATQVWVMRSCGLSIARPTIRNLARPVRWWQPDIAAVTFKDTDVSRSLPMFLSDRQEIAAEARIAIRKAEPAHPIGMHCYKPFPCEFRDHCSRSSK